MQGLTSSLLSSSTIMRSSLNGCVTVAKQASNARSSQASCQSWVTIDLLGKILIIVNRHFSRTINFCKTKVPQYIYDDLEPIKTDDEEVRKYGVQFGIKQCQEFIKNGFRFLHFYTMNLETAVIKIIKGLGILDQQKRLPFRKPSTRLTEEVRPIFWAIKPKSYISRTQEWDEFPNGRWGVSRSPAFGNPEMYGSIAKRMSFNFDELKKMYGENISKYSDISDVFINYLTGKIRKYPFSEGSL